MNKMCISVSDDFSEAPGARSKSDGPDSGQEFYESLLRPKFNEAMSNKIILEVDMDGTYGYATSFISESFGTLSKEFGKEIVLKNISIVSNEDIKLKDYVLKIIQDPNAK